MKKKVLISTIVVMSFILGTLSGQAAGLLVEIKAFLNHEISFELDGANWQPKDAAGNAVTPITYNGTTYVPLRAVSQALDVPVDYDGVKKRVILGEKRDSVSLLSSTVNLDKKNSYYTSSVSLDANDLKFNNKQYSSAFKIEDVNSNRKKIVIDFGKAYSKGHIVAAAKFDKGHTEMKFRVLNDKDETLYTGTLTDIAPVLEFDFEISGMTRYLSVDFEAKVGADSVGYVLRDDSWVK